MAALTNATLKMPKVKMPKGPKMPSVAQPKAVKQVAKPPKFKMPKFLG